MTLEYEDLISHEIGCDTCRKLDKKTRSCVEYDPCLFDGECEYEGKKRIEEYPYSRWEPKPSHPQA